MKRVIQVLGSLQIAVPLLIVIAGVLAWGTIYEARFGTAAVQRVIYTSWWFQALLAFLAVNLAVAALERYPWKRRQIPFIMAHIGIILILLGGIIGGRFGTEGQLMVSEGQAERLLQLPQNVLAIHQPHPGFTEVIPTRFESRAWVHEPNAVFQVPLKDRLLRLTIDRYFPDAQLIEEIGEGGAEDNPAVRLTLSHEAQQEDVWLLAKDPERFGARWGDAHLLFLEPVDAQQFNRLLEGTSAPQGVRGVVSVSFAGETRPHEIPVPAELNTLIPIKGTPYTVTFKDYFPDFAMTEQGITSQSDQPNNPAISFILTGPEGSDAHLLFAFHPDFPAIHARDHMIRAQVSYAHPAGLSLPRSSITLLRAPAGDGLSAVMTGSDTERQSISPLEAGKRYTHPWLGYQFEVASYVPRARMQQHMSNRSDEVRAEALHLVAQLGHDTAEAWLRFRQSVELSLGGEVFHVEYRPAQRELPVTIKLSDFRKIDYPGTQMAAGFESDVQLSDPQRGVILMRTIKMNTPLKYRGLTFYQSSYVPGSTETTVLSVRNDPGTPLVYAGFVTVILGVVVMFVLRHDGPMPRARRRKR